MRIFFACCFCGFKRQIENPCLCCSVYLEKFSYVIPYFNLHTKVLLWSEHFWSAFPNVISQFWSSDVSFGVQKYKRIYIIDFQKNILYMPCWKSFVLKQNSCMHFPLYKKMQQLFSTLFVEKLCKSSRFVCFRRSNARFHFLVHFKNI